MKKVTVETNEFVRAHGKEPKGFGLWAFEIAGVQHHFTGTFSEAKRKARTAAYAVGATEIKVLS
jgi:hypothetical protein